MSTNRWVNPVENNFLRDLEGTILADGSIAIYLAGTSTAQEVYSDVNQSVSLGSILNADGFGRLPDFHLPAGTQVKVVAYDAQDGPDGAGAVKWTRDYVFSADSSTDTRLDALEASVAAIQAGYGNAIVNGGMRVPGRFGSVTLTTSYQEGGVAELWGKIANVSAGTLAQTADSDYSTGYVAHFSGVSTSDAAATVDAQFRISSKDAQRFANGGAIFTCKVEHDKGSAVNYTVTISKADVADDFSAITAIETGSAQSVTSGAITTLSLSADDMGDCSNGIAITVSAAAGVVTTKNFKVGVAQFEEGTTASGFSEMPYYSIAAAVAERQSPQGIYLLGEYTLAGGSTDYIDIVASGDVDADLSSWSFVIVEGFVNIDGTITQRAPVFEIGDGSLANTAVYNYMMVFHSSSSGTTALTTHADATPVTTVDKAARLVYSIGSNQLFRFRLVLRKPISSDSEERVWYSVHSSILQNFTGAGNICWLDGHVTSLADFDRIRIYMTSDADSSVSTQNFTDVKLKVYGTNNAGYAVH